MPRWLFVLVLPGGTVIAAVLAIGWLIRRANGHRQLSVDEELALIKTPKPLFVGHDEALAKRTMERRKAADKIRVRASHIESGAPVSDVLRMVRR